MSIYTKTGDRGKTSLFGGKRLSKACLQIEAYGSLDELTSIIGLLAAKESRKKVQSFLQHIQKDLYQIMSLLSGADLNLTLISQRTIALEQEIDILEKRLPKLTRFILPGGTERSSLTHLARAICRRAERQVVTFFQEEKTSGILLENKPITLQYLNRLSDFLFMFARRYARGKEILT